MDNGETFEFDAPQVFIVRSSALWTKNDVSNRHLAGHYFRFTSGPMAMVCLSGTGTFIVFPGLP